MTEVTPAKGALIAILAMLMVMVTVALWLGGGYLSARWLDTPGGGKPGAGLGLLLAAGLWVPFLGWCGFDVSMRKVFRWDENWKDRATDERDNH